MTLALVPWAVWALYFAIVEGRALLRGRVQDTLSWEVWRAEHKRPLVRIGVALFCLWLFEHFVFEWF